jgi:RND family efflux transporter MFP subunit
MNPSVSIRCKSVTLLVVVLTGCGGARSGNEAATPGRSSDVSANGVVEGASREVALRPEVAGIIAALHVHENQEVAAGQLLFELQNDSQRARVALARAELATARIEADHAETNLHRSSRLFSRQALSAESYEKDSFQRALTQARVAEAKARMEIAEAELARTRIRAADAGRILQVFAPAGASAGPQSADPVARMADLSRRRVRAFVDELDMARVQPGQRALVTATGVPGREFPGIVTALSPRMGKTAVTNEAPEEYRDVYFREVMIDLDEAFELPLNLRVEVRILKRVSDR